MKPRKVMVHLELKSDVPIKKLLEKDRWVWKKDSIGPEMVEVQQVTANVVKPEK